MYLQIRWIMFIRINTEKKIVDGSSPTTDRLYRNDWDSSLNHPIFTNVSREAGILVEGFGLGLNITDINMDGWKDIYVTNDFFDKRSAVD